MKIICFDFDDVIVKGNPVSKIAFILKDKFKEMEIGLKLLTLKDNPKEFTKSLKELVSLSKGIDYKLLEDLMLKAFLTKNTKKTFKEISEKNKIVIISMNDTNLIKKFLGKNKLLEYVDHIYGSELEVKNGKLTGIIKGDVLESEKRTIIKKVEKKYKVGKKNIIYVGDGLTDLPIIEELGQGILFCPNSITRAEVYENKKLSRIEKKGKLLWIEKEDLYEVESCIKILTK